jgi:Transcription initiation factor IIF, alpha subunit (TFIIF-alpha)
MRFNYNLNIDFSQWRNIKLERENNMKEFRGMEEELPKFGAGSEYNRDQKEEARRKKFGIIAKKYNPDAQPWILKIGKNSGTASSKKFRGVSRDAYSLVFEHCYNTFILKIKKFRFVREASVKMQHILYSHKQKMAQLRHFLCTSGTTSSPFNVIRR